MMNVSDSGWNRHKVSREIFLDKTDNWPESTAWNIPDNWFNLVNPLNKTGTSPNSGLQSDPILPQWEIQRVTINMQWGGWV